MELALTPQRYSTELKMGDLRQGGRRSALGLLAGVALATGARGAETAAVSPNSQVNVTDFLTPDQRQRALSRSGAGDCTAAFRSAFASGAAGVLAPRGVYAIQAGLRIPPGVSLVGEGYGTVPARSATLLVKLGSGDGLVVDACSQVCNLALDSASGT